MKTIIKYFILFIALVATSLSLAACGGNEDTIAIVKFGTHTSLDEIENSIMEEIKEKLPNIKIKNYDCNFSPDIITANISSIKSNKNVKVCVAIATPVAAVAKSMLTDIPVVFAAVSDPVAAGIVENMNAPEGNITGTSDAIDIAKLVDLATEVNHEVKTLGYIYTASEANSISNLEKLSAYAIANGYTLRAKQISNAAEITEVSNSLLTGSNKVDALIVTDDNNVASAMSVLALKCAEAKVPCYCAADSEIKDGGFMGYSVSYSALGRKTGNMVCDIINGKAINEIPVSVFESSELNLFYNSDFVLKSGISIPDNLLEKATDLK